MLPIFRVEPILYRHIKLRGSSQADAFIRALDSLHSKLPNFFASSTKSLSFTYGVTFHQAAKILSTCTNITKLASRIEFSQKTLDITLDDIMDFGRFMTARSPTLRRLSVTLQPFHLCPDPSFRLPLFQHLTHLSIFGASGHCRKWSWMGFDALEHLTHFAFEIDTSTDLQAVDSLRTRFPPLLRVCLIILSVKDDKLPLERYLKENNGIQQMVLGDTDRRIVVGITERLELQDTLAWGRGLIAAKLWDDALDDAEIWARAESSVNTRVHSPGVYFQGRPFASHVH